MFLSKVFKSIDHPYMEGRGGRKQNNIRIRMQGMTLESLKNHVGIAPHFVMSGITLSFIASAQCKSSSETKYPEVLIAVDYSLHKNLGENEARTQQYVQNHFTAVNAMFANLS